MYIHIYIYIPRNNFKITIVSTILGAIIRIGTRITATSKNQFGQDRLMERRSNCLQLPCAFVCVASMKRHVRSHQLCILHHSSHVCLHIRGSAACLSQGQQIIQSDIPRRFFCLRGSWNTPGGAWTSTMNWHGRLLEWFELRFLGRRYAVRLCQEYLAFATQVRCGGQHPWCYPVSPGCLGGANWFFNIMSSPRKAQTTSGTPSSPIIHCCLWIGTLHDNVQGLFG